MCNPVLVKVYDQLIIIILLKHLLATCCSLLVMLIQDLFEVGIIIGIFTVTNDLVRPYYL